MTDEEQKQNSLVVAFGKAAQILAAADPRTISERSGARFGDNTYEIEFLGTSYQIQVPEVSFVTAGLPIIAEVLILHYLTSVDDQPAKGEFLSFQSLPGGMFYAKSFQDRAVDKLLAGYESDPQGLSNAASALGGQKWTTGDFSSVLSAFPRIDVVVQTFKGDEEFPAEANILFSDNVVNFLPIEDTAFLGGWVVSNLLRGND